ncbi:MAG: hypothetical protein O3B72_09090 [Proteobacteria bacterium]|nr:hypothetical protein [Pseudomonadota bacterium]
MKEETQTAQPVDKKAYVRPQLKNHGRLKDLTTGGSGMQQEMLGKAMTDQSTKFP